MSTDLIDRYVDERQQEKATNATINRELAVLKRAFNLGLAATPPKVHRVPHFHMLKENNVRTGFLEQAQYERLASACADRGLVMRALFELGYVYGWRHEELLGLRVKQVSVMEEVIRLNPGETKNDEAREVELTKNALLLLRQCVQGKQPNDFVFTRENGEPVRDFRGSWARATQEAGVPDLLFHDLRRTAIRNMVRDGIPERIAMQISGHKTRAVFDRYNIVSRADIRAAIGKIDERMTRVEPQEEEKEDAKPEPTGKIN